MKNKAFWGLSLLFFAVFVLGIVFFTLEKPLSSTLRAKNSQPSNIKSFGTVFPQMAFLRQEEENSQKKSFPVKVTIILRDNNGDFLPQRKIKLLSSLPEVSISPPEGQTDENGRVNFLLTSTVPGKAQLTAIDIASQISINNIPSVEFKEE